MLINFSVLAIYHFICTRFIFPLTGNVRCHKKEGAEKKSAGPRFPDNRDTVTLRNIKSGKNKSDARSRSRTCEPLRERILSPPLLAT